MNLFGSDCDRATHCTNTLWDTVVHMRYYTYSLSIRFSRSPVRLDSIMKKIKLKRAWPRREKATSEECIVHHSDNATEALTLAYDRRTRGHWTHYMCSLHAITCVSLPDYMMSPFSRVYDNDDTMDYNGPFSNVNGHGSDTFGWLTDCITSCITRQIVQLTISVMWQRHDDTLMLFRIKH